MSETIENKKRSIRSYFGIPVHDSLAITIALLSLLVSAATAYFQFVPTYRVFYRMDNNSVYLYATGPRVAKPFTDSVRVTVYNLSNRPVSINDITLFLVPMQVRPDTAIVPSLCPDTAQYDLDARKDDSRFLSFPTHILGEKIDDPEEKLGFVMQPNSIESKVVYIAPFPTDFRGPFRLEGLLCAKLTGTDWKGNDTGATQEIALIKIDVPAQSGKEQDIRVNPVTNIVGTERAPNREMQLLGPYHYVPYTPSEQPTVPAPDNTLIVTASSIETTRNEQAPQTVLPAAR